MVLGAGEEVLAEMGDWEGSGSGVNVVGQQGMHKCLDGQWQSHLAGRIDYIEHGAGCGQYMVEGCLNLKCTFSMTMNAWRTELALAITRGKTLQVKMVYLICPNIYIQTLKPISKGGLVA